MQRFDNMTVVVTGAASGIGAACVRRLYSEGARVALADVSQEGIDTLALAPLTRSDASASRKKLRQLQPSFSPVMQVS
jgi:NAD(P)-dependent dehydrogenase (short-subunit alcohol dehydrogenase family)